MKVKLVEMNENQEKKTSKPAYQLVTARITKEMYNYVRSAAKVRDISVSAFVSQVISEYAKQDIYTPRDLWANEADDAGDANTDEAIPMPGEQIEQMGRELHQAYEAYLVSRERYLKTRTEHDHELMQSRMQEFKKLELQAAKAKTLAYSESN